MKAASPELLDFLATAREYVRVDVVTFELLGGTDEAFYRLRYTAGQQDLTAAPVDGSPGLFTWRANRVLVKGLRFKAGIGLAVYDSEAVLTPLEGATVQGLTFQEAVRRRIFDGATVRRDRYYFERFGLPPVGGIPMFRGLVSTGRMLGPSVTLKVKAATVLLDQMMPRHLNQPTCIWTIYDGGCSLVKDDLAVVGTVGPGATRSVIPWAGIDAGFALGSIFFENLGLVGIRRTIRAVEAGALVLAYPLPSAPVEGEDFVAYPGCDGSLTRCTELGNTANRRSYDFVPRPETAF